VPSAGLARPLLSVQAAEMVYKLMRDLGFDHDTETDEFVNGAVRISAPIIRIAFLDEGARAVIAKVREITDRLANNGDPGQRIKI
jgi:hypothetical protein